MKTKFLIPVFLLLFTLVFFTSCVEEETFSTPTKNIKTYDLTANRTVASIVASLNPAPPAPPLLNSDVKEYTEDDIIEAYVTSSDETGNFFATISLQSELNSSSSAPIGMSVAVDLKSYSKGFAPGRKIFIKLKGLHIAIVDGSLKIGALFNGSIGRISKYEWENHLFPSAVIVPEIELVRTLTLAQAATTANLNTLVDIENLQFSDNSLSRTLFDATLNNIGNATNHQIVDTNTGLSRIFRVSSFSLFKSSIVPTGKGKIRGIMTRFGSDYQLILRYIDDMELTTPRSYNFASTLNEGFQSFAVNTRNFPNYLNFSVEGTKDWLVRSGNFIEMSAFGGNVESNKSYFLVPVNMTAANSFSFQYRIQFYSNRTGLKVYRTTDYVPGTKISNATLVDISTSFAIPSATTTSFAPAGVYNIPPSVTGNGFFVFEYTGTSLTSSLPVTTTVQIDNIVVN